ncbi:MAG: hypothetical protein ABEK50_00020 [bacterium]
MKRRQRIVINRSFQWKMVGLLAGTLLSALILFGSFAWYQYQLIQQFMALHTEHLASVNGEIAYYATVIGTAFLLLFALGVLLAIRLTHRVVGPVNRLRDELELMRKKDEINVLAVRDDDELKDLVEAINKVILHLQDE